MSTCIRGGVKYKRHHYKEGFCKCCGYKELRKVIKNPRPLALTLTKFCELYVKPWAKRMADQADEIALKQFQMGATK